ncbi:type I-B CRISPR-associated protein Cas7/Cst2/DevR [Lyngbya aestuarii]|uniref:type I-B CRISPR-associated protein Cas7/Cst2/DevR n=1 Tax=Lyngbya aestuarii TaxID=118322 RepID=UPI00403DE26C
MFHLFGNILTHYGTAANNRGENEGNITPLQKLEWKGETHTTVSAEAIRWALRYYWQKAGYQVNRHWDEDAKPVADHILQEPNYDEERFIDDDVLGFMRAEAAKLEASEPPKDKQNKVPKGKVTARRGRLDVTRAVSTTPYGGDITFNAKSGQKGTTSLYGTEVHATRYQYGFVLTPDRLKDKSRIYAVLDGLISIGEVAGNHARFLFDFSPESIVLRWTHDFSPRFLYCFKEYETGEVLVPDLVQRVDAGDIDAKELWIGGAISQTLGDLGANVFPGVKSAVAALKQVIAEDLQLSSRSS